jgi:uncharacterized membrane protein (UPF0127 family)
MPRKKMMMAAMFVFGVLILFGGVYFWHLAFSRAQNPQLVTAQVTVGGATFAAELATTTVEQTRGLSFRSSLAEGSGMLFTFRPGIQNFWMKDMNFPIDMIWIAGNKVAGFVQNAQPKPGVPLWELTVYTSPDGVDKVLEVNAGTVAKDNIVVGDPVVFGQGIN